MPWYMCNMGHKHRTQDASTNCHYCRDTHRRWIEGMEQKKRDWEKRKKEIGKNNFITKREFLKLDHRQRWDVVSLLTNVDWYCEHCDLIVDGGKRPQRMFPEGSRHCGSCDGMLTRRTGGGMSDPCGYYPLEKKAFKKDQEIEMNNETKGAQIIKNIWGDLYPTFNRALKQYRSLKPKEKEAIIDLYDKTYPDGYEDF